MELAISIVSAIAAIVAAWLAYKAWRKPQPDLEFVDGTARYTKAHSGRYFLEVQATVKNSSSVDAVLNDIKINGISLKDKSEEKVSLDTWDVIIITLYKFVPRLAWLYIKGK